MQRTQEDQRVKRTRQLLSNALISLMVERGYDAVTVQHILDRAGVGRSTFYSHFAGKEALLRSSFDNLRRGMMEHWKNALAAESKGLGELAFALPFFKHLRESRHLFRAFSRGEAAVILDQELHKMLTELVRADLTPGFRAKGSKAEFEIAVQFVTGAMTSLINWWMERNASVSAEDLNRAFVTLALDGVRSISNYPPTEVGTPNLASPPQHSRTAS